MSETWSRGLDQPRAKEAVEWITKKIAWCLVWNNDKRQKQTKINSRATPQCLFDRNKTTLQRNIPTNSFIIHPNQNKRSMQVERGEKRLQGPCCLHSFVQSKRTAFYNGSANVVGFCGWSRTRWVEMKECWKCLDGSSVWVDVSKWRRSDAIPSVKPVNLSIDLGSSHDTTFTVQSIPIQVQLLDHLCTTRYWIIVQNLSLKCLEDLSRLGKESRN